MECECHSHHYLVIHWHGEDGYLSIGGQYRPSRWKHRLEVAWQSLTGRAHMDSWVEIHLDPAKARQLAEILRETGATEEKK